MINWTRGMATLAGVLLLTEVGVARGPTGDLIQRLKDKDPEVRAVAAAALARPASADDVVAIPSLIEAGKDNNPTVRAKAVYALCMRNNQLQALRPHLQTVTTAALLRALGDENSQVRLYGAKGLGRRNESDKTVLAALTKVLCEDQAAAVRAQAAITLGNIGPAASSAVPQLLRSLKDKDKDVRAWSASALGAIRVTDNGVVLKLAEALKDEAVEVRRLAGLALGAFGPEAKDAVPSLITALQDKDTVVRRAAANTLYRLGLAARPAVPALTAALKDQDPLVREDAARALAGLPQK
jgi:HEAT repeat protein